MVLQVDKKYLKRRHNRYWARVRIPKHLVNIFGKTELQQNLFTNDLAEATKLKHGVIAKFMGQFYKAELKLKERTPESKRDNLLELAKTKRKEIDAYSYEEIEKVKDLGILVDDLESMVSDVYGKNNSSDIVYYDPNLVDTAGVDLKAVEAANDAYQIINPDSNPLSSLAEKFLSEKTQLKKSSFLTKGKKHKAICNLEWES